MNCAGSSLGRMANRCSSMLLVPPSSLSQTISQARGNAWRASLGKVSRTQYLNRYRVRLLRPDGSSIDTMASEPREVVQLAIDLKALSEDERRQRLAARKPKVKKIQQEVIDDNFDASDYMKFFTDAKTSSPSSTKN